MERLVPGSAALQLAVQAARLVRLQLAEELGGSGRQLRDRRGNGGEAEAVGEQDQVLGGELLLAGDAEAGGIVDQEIPAEGALRLRGVLAEGAGQEERLAVDARLAGLPLHPQITPVRLELARLHVVLE